MLIKLSNKQLNLLRRLLPTCKLNAYDIQIFQEIITALDNPLDHNIVNKVSSEPVRNTHKLDNKPGIIQSQSKPIIKQQEVIPESNYIANVKKSIEELKDEITELDDEDNIQNDSDETEYIEDDEPANIFAVIDRRVKK